MLKKAKAEAQAEAAGEPSSKGVRDSSRHIWLAGLGAFSRAQAEGTKLFESLVEQGQKLEARTRSAATQTAAAAAGAATQKAKEMQAMAGGTWDKLEQVFEDRVARALAKIGVHTQDDVAHLSRRVEALAEAVNELIKSGEKKAPARRPVKKRGATRVGKAGVKRAQPPVAEAAVKTPTGRKPRKTTKRPSGG